MIEDTLQAYIEEFAMRTQLEWQLQDADTHAIGGEDYIFIFLGVIVLFILVCWLIERRKRSSAVIAVAIAALALSSCAETYHATTEQPFVAGHSLGVNPSEATIKVGRKTAVISQGDVKTVPRDSVTVDGKAITVGFTERIKIVYEL